MTKGTIKCVGKGGTAKDFYYTFKPGIPDLISGEIEEWSLKVYASTDHSDSTYVEVVAKRSGQERLRIDVIKNHGGDMYSAKGIPESVVAELAKLTDLCVCSSSQEEPKFPNEGRTPQATNYWRRLECKGKAEYDKTTDVYTFIP